MEETFTENDGYGEAHMCVYASKFIKQYSFISIKPHASKKEILHRRESEKYEVTCL